MGIKIVVFDFAKSFFKEIGNDDYFRMSGESNFKKIITRWNFLADYHIAKDVRFL